MLVHLPIFAHIFFLYSNGHNKQHNHQIDKRKQQDSHSNCRKKKSKQRKDEKRGSKEVPPLALQKRTCQKSKKDTNTRTCNFKKEKKTKNEEIAEKINMMLQEEYIFFPTLTPDHKLEYYLDYAEHLKPQFKKMLL